MLAGALVFFAGAASQPTLLKLRRATSGAAMASTGDTATVYRDNFNTGVKPVSCPKVGNIMVAVIVGQSNVANHGAALTKAGPRAFVFYNGLCYPAEDPLLGSTGQGGSVWPAFADRVLASGTYDAVLLVPAAVGGSRMEAWAPGGVLSARIEQRVSALAQAGLEPTHFLVQQGEAEGAQHSDAKSYQANATALLFSLKATGADVIFATATRCMGERNESIRKAQSAAREATGSIAGPDADQIGIDRKVGGCHYDATAQVEMSQAWASAVSPTAYRSGRR